MGETYQALSVLQVMISWAGEGAWERAYKTIFNSYRVRLHVIIAIKMDTHPGLIPGVWEAASFSSSPLAVLSCQTCLDLGCPLHIVARSQLQTSR